MDNPNSLFLTETWETKKDRRESKGTDSWLAQKISSLSEKPKFSCADAQGKMALIKYTFITLIIGLQLT